MRALTPAMGERRHDLDWLRVIAFLVLIFFHAAIAYIPHGLPMIHNADVSPPLMLAVAFFSQFRLGLLFLVSGAGVAFALRHRDRTQFIMERSQRLLIPLIFGVLVLVPPMVYLEKTFNNEITGSLFAFYKDLFSAGVYPRGNLSWHHFWFVAYLYLYCVLGWRFLYHLTQRPNYYLRLIAWLSQKANLLWFLLPLIVLELPLRAVFPGFRDLIHDWASFVHWFLLFVAGFVFAHAEDLSPRSTAILPESPSTSGSTPASTGPTTPSTSLLDAAGRNRRLYLVLATLATLTLFGTMWNASDGRFVVHEAGLPRVIDYVLLCVLRMVMVWSILLAIVGFAATYLRHRSAVLDYLTEAVYPLFCVHLTITVALGFVVVPTALPIAAKYLTVSLGTLTIGLALFHWVIAPSSWLRPLFGMKPKQDRQRVSQPKAAT